MRLLLLCHRLPYPPHKGEKIRAWNMLKFLAERHEVSLACLADRAELDQVAALRPYAREILIERIRPRLRLALASRAVLGAGSITSEYFHSRTLQRRIDELMARGRIEGVLCSSSPMATYLFGSRHRERWAGIRRVMDLIDVDSHKWRQYAEDSPAWAAWLYRREARCLAQLERRITREFDRVLVVSEQERRYFPDPASDRSAAEPGAQPWLAERLVAMPNGVDLEFFAPHERAQPPASAQVSTTPTLVFTGVMSYRPNVDAMVWFAERILPQVRAAVPGVRLCVVGSEPTRQVLRLGALAGVTVTGHVPDVRPYLASAAVCIVPLRIARGLQNKVLEAMAMERAVVVTRAAFEGIEAAPGRDLLVADDARSFADAVIDLLRDPERRAQLGRSARACVARRYAWGTNLQLLDELFPCRERGPEALVDAGGPAPPESARFEAV